MYIYLVLNKSAYRSLLYIDVILFVKTIFDFSSLISGRISGYPASLLSGEWNRISGRILDIKNVGYPANRISNTTLVKVILLGIENRYL